MKMNKLVVSMFAAGIFATPMAYATNGMLMEGYGPISAGMGGASMAFDNGAAAMANNPATLGLMADGTSRMDLAIGGLHPSVTSTCTSAPCNGAAANSGGKSYFMPAGGWVKKDGALAYGIGVFAQGGMGTEYTANDWVGAGSGKPSRSEVGVGNLIIPLSYNVTPDLNIAGSLDLVWGGMDLQMAMNANQMGQLAAGGNLIPGGPAAASPAFGAFMAGGATSVGYFNFTDGSKFTGKANSTGWAGKLGMTYKISSQLTVGATYHSKTSLGNMTADGATMDMIMAGATVGTFTGKVSIVDFQFPETYGFGVALQATDDLMIAADYKRIGWAKVMKNFHMNFVATNGSLTLDMKMPQNWADQDVFNLGIAYRTTPELTLRAGANLANNPVPSNTVNPLFPAIVKDHFTVGAGYAVSKTSEVNASLVYVPKVTTTTPAVAGVSPSYTISHSQMNWQLMYSHYF